MLFPHLEQLETYYLITLGLVGEPGLAVLAVLWVIFIFVGAILFNLVDPAGGGESPPPAGGNNSGGETPAGGDNGGSKWKKILLGVVIGVTTTVVAVGVAGWVGWNDPFFAFKQPTIFVAAGVTNLGRVIPGLTLTGEEARTYLGGIYVEVYKSVSNSGVVFPKIVEAHVQPGKYLAVQTAIEALALDPGAAINNVLATYPHGASEATLRAALEIALTDRVDTLILEHAEEWW